MKMKERITKLEKVVTLQNEILQGYQELLILNEELSGGTEE